MKTLVMRLLGYLRFLTLTVSATLVIATAAVNGTGASPASTDDTKIIRIGGDGRDSATAAAMDRERNVYVVGSTGSSQIRGQLNHGGSDIFVVKISPAGRIAWLRLIGSEDDEQPTGVAALPDGSIVVSGMWEHDLVEPPWPVTAGRLWRVSPDGRTMWMRHLRGVGSLADVAADRTGSFYVTGSAEHSDNDDVIVYKFGADGRIEWRRQILAPSGEAGSDIVATGAGVAIVGSTIGGGFPGARDSASENRPFVLRYDQSGRRRGVTFLDTPKRSYGGSIAASSSGSIVSAGNTWDDGSAGGATWMASVSRLGHARWQGSLPEGARSVSDVAATSDDRFLVVGATGSEEATEAAFWLVSARGRIVAAQSFDEGEWFATVTAGDGQAWLAGSSRVRERRNPYDFTDAVIIRCDLAP